MFFSDDDVTVEKALFFVVVVLFGIRVLSSFGEYAFLVLYH